VKAARDKAENKRMYFNRRLTYGKQHSIFAWHANGCFYFDC